MRFIRSVLGFSDYKTSKANVKSVREQLPRVPVDEDVRVLTQAATRTSDIVNDLIASEEQTESGAQTDEQNYLKYRELVALDKS